MTSLTDYFSPSFSILLPVFLHSSPQVKDEAFDEAEKRFRLQERLIKSFIRDISLYLQHIRVKALFQTNKPQLKIPIMHCTALHLLYCIQLLKQHYGLTVLSQTSEHAMPYPELTYFPTTITTRQSQVKEVKRIFYFLFYCLF